MTVHKTDYAALGLPTEHGRNAFHMAAPRVITVAEAKRLYNRVKKQEQYARQAAARVNREEPSCTPNDYHKTRRIERASI